MSTLAADAVLLVHFAFVAFVIGGFALIWLGAVLHWAWIRNFTFRSIHLAAICFVAAEAAAGVMCPLTVWEDALRGTHTETSFVARWVRRMLFYDLPEWVFTAAYLAFAALVALTLWLVPPKRRQRE
jgi:polyferredoxin